MNTINVWLMTVVLLSGLALSGCDWVDSAGSEGSTVTVTEVFLNDVRVGEAIVINEQSPARITTTRRTASNLEQTFTWSEAPLQQGNLPVCADQDGFKPEFAADSLAQACKAGTDCSFDIEAVAIDPEADLAEFRVLVPTLDASVGLNYSLGIEDSSGDVITSEYSFCLIAMNEAPFAEDDTFVVTEGTVLNVTLATVNLLSNDTDDTDASNIDLFVVPEAVTAPKNAAFFELGNDGSFTYQSSLSDLREDQFDTFVYEVGDGSFTSRATATIRVVAANQAPQLIAPIPILSATEGERFTIDLATRFIDPENGSMTFSLAALTPLAIGTGMTLSRAGVLSGIPTAADVGSYQLTLLVSDGGQSTEADITLEVDAAPIVLPNRAPVFVTGTVFNQSVRRLTAILPVEPQFTDADGDTLTYSLISNGTLPVGVSINPTTGVISGRPRFTASYSLRVAATDPTGASSLSTFFSLTVSAN